VLAAHIPIHYGGKSETEREARYTFTGWSAQRDRHGAYKLKPSVARFQLVFDKPLGTIDNTAVCFVDCVTSVSYRQQ